MIHPQLVLPQWTQLYHLVPRLFPLINVFSIVAQADELALVFAIEALTNDRLKEAEGNLHRLPEKQRITGPGTKRIMAAFTHTGYASRFTDGFYGVYYGANSLDTALAESIYHRELFLSATKEPDTELTMQAYSSTVVLPLHDIRTLAYRYLMVPGSYLAAQIFARTFRARGSNGLLYPSVRHKGGQCVAAFKPKTIGIAEQGQHYRYIYSAHQQKIVALLEVFAAKSSLFLS
jgi:hypothetical protein